ncbi:MAG: type II toxin-antitoxin system RelB/DinJ family antitoxin [Spirochaetia bacterium]|nr:type II toxin-antitoxin system RelB/DinJ family antitoxin [Spirochaetia bacterium]
MANLTITLDDEDKKNISEFCDYIGMTVSGLYNVFTKTVLREGRIPFEIGIEKPNRKTIKAMKEGDKLIEKYKKDPKSVKTYNNVDELMEAMLK